MVPSSSEPSAPATSPSLATLGEAGGTERAYVALCTRSSQHRAFLFTACARWEVLTQGGAFDRPSATTSTAFDNAGTGIGNASPLTHKFPQLHEALQQGLILLSSGEVSHHLVGHTPAWCHQGAVCSREKIRRILWQDKAVQSHLGQSVALFNSALTIGGTLKPQACPSAFGLRAVAEGVPHHPLGANSGVLVHQSKAARKPICWSVNGRLAFKQG